MNPREQAILRDKVARALLGPEALANSQVDVRIGGSMRSSKMTEEDVDAVRRSVADGLPLMEIARRHWRSYGYASPESCRKALARALAH